MSWSAADCRRIMVSTRAAAAVVLPLDSQSIKRELECGSRMKVEIALMYATEQSRSRKEQTRCKVGAGEAHSSSYESDSSGPYPRAGKAGTRSATAMATSSKSAMHLSKVWRFKGSGAAARHFSLSL
eukprot:scaffold170310_cov28-Tisochrysis_lutea.AAC.6